MFTIRSTSYSLRGDYVLFFSTVSESNFLWYSLFPYMVSKLWNSLPESFKTSNFYDFNSSARFYSMTLLVVLNRRML